MHVRGRQRASIARSYSFIGDVIRPRPPEKRSKDRRNNRLSKQREKEKRTTTHFLAAAKSEELILRPILESIKNRVEESQTTIREQAKELENIEKSAGRREGRGEKERRGETFPR